jgi:alanine dehydrogenase
MGFIYFQISFLIFFPRFGVYIESGAGVASKFTDEVYAAAGATIVADAKQLYDKVEVVLKVRFFFFYFY